jgi:hypothetical protein
VLASLSRVDEVHVINRGTSTLRPPPAGVHQHRADIHCDEVTDALGSVHFNAVVDFVCYSAADARRAESVFTEHTDQYIVISSATVYRKPVARFPTTSQPCWATRIWPTPRPSLAAEQTLLVAFRDRAFPVTVVWPSHPGLALGRVDLRRPQASRASSTRLKSGHSCRRSARR